METKIFGVATKAIVYNQNGEYLVLKKGEKEDIAPETFDFPGGRVQFGEKPEEALVREVMEETGFNVEPKGVINTWSFVKEETFQLIGIDFLCKYSGGGELVLSSEHNEGKWMKASEIIDNQNFPGWLIKTIKKAESFRNSLVVA